MCLMKYIKVIGIIFVIIFSIACLTSISQSQVWIHSGPDRGTIYSLAPAAWDSSIVFMSTLRGGVYRFNCNTYRWESCNETFPQDSTAHIDYIMYGIHPQVDVFASHEDVPGKIWAGTRGMGLWISQDYGETWFSANNGIPENSKIIEIQIIQNDDGKFWIPGLVNTLDNMTPGEGYYIYLIDDVTFTYNTEAQKNTGQVVYNLQRQYNAGRYDFVFNTTDSFVNLASGLYFIEIRYNNQSFKRKLMLLK